MKILMRLIILLLLMAGAAYPATVTTVPSSRTVCGHPLTADVSCTKADLGIGNVENTALSTWAGTSNITTLGTITSGTWHGSAIADSYISSASTWNAKQAALTSYSTIVGLWTSCTSGYLKYDGSCSTPAGGGGNVSNSGTPTIHQWGVWTDSTHVKGVSVTASKVACSDSNGEPVACTNLTDTAIPTVGLIAPYNVGTLTNTDLCTYVTGTGFVCNTAPSTFQAALTNPLVAGTLNTGYLCTKNAASNTIDCNTATSTFQASGSYEVTTNKENTTIDTSTTKYPTVNLLKTGLDAKVNTSRTVAGHALTADVTVSKSDVGLGNVDNTADTAKPVSTAQQSALDLKLPVDSPIITGTLVIGSAGVDPTVAMTSATYSKTSDTSLANITGLTLNVKAAYTYSFTAKLYTTSGSSGGVKVAIGGTATATAIVYEGTATNSGTITQGRATSLGSAVAAVTNVTAAYVEISGTITVNASGTLTVQFAQNASNGTASNVLANSSFTVQQRAYQAGSGGGIMYVTTQVDVTSNATLANVTQLQASPTSGSKFRFTAKLFTTSGSSGGIKVAIGGNATATAVIYEGLGYNSGSVTQGRSTSLGTAVVAVTNVTAEFIKIEGVITVNQGTECTDPENPNSCTTQTFGVQFSQNASNGTASSILVGSSFELSPY